MIDYLYRDGSYEFGLPVPKYQTANLSVGGLGDAVAPMPGVIEKVTRLKELSATNLLKGLVTKFRIGKLLKKIVNVILD